MRRIVYAIKDRFHPHINKDSSPEVRSDNPFFRTNEEFFKWCKQHGAELSEVYPVNNRIFAFLENKEGRGRWRCWRAFSFTNKDGAVQADAEAFMVHMFHSPKYFLVMEIDLEIRPEYPYQYYYNGTGVYETNVTVANQKTRRRFIVT